MSYDLELFFEPALPLRQFQEYFASRKHYIVDTAKVSYQNKYTGVNFWFDYKPRRSLSGKRVSRAHFEINYFRPSFFGLEAEIELSALIEAFKPRIFDQQMQGMAEGPYSAEGFLRGWNFGNVFATHNIMRRDSDDPILTLPASQLQSAWRWNYGFEQRRLERGDGQHVPRIFCIENQGRAAHCVSWGEGVPILLPPVDYVGVTPGAQADRWGLVAYAQLVEFLASLNIAVDSQPLDLHERKYSARFIEWMYGISQLDADGMPQMIYHYQVIDREVLDAAAEMAEQVAPA